MKNKKIEKLKEELATELGQILCLGYEINRSESYGSKLIIVFYKKLLSGEKITEMIEQASLFLNSDLEYKHLNLKTEIDEKTHVDKTLFIIHLK